jgi:DNA polymerase I-like protein with 3'-5' exonuclease and polymerase domains
VHDELVFEVKKGREAEFAAQIKNIMETVYPLEAGVVAEAKAGKSWGDMTKLEV